MINSNTSGKPRKTQNPLVQKFAEKSELLLIESCKLIQEENNTKLMISLLSYHQATEFSLKAYCKFVGININESDNKTISFSKARKKVDILTDHQQQLLEDLNLIRNNLQHNAIFDISNKPLILGLLEYTIEINTKIYQAINYDCSELDIYLVSNYSFFRP